MFGGIFFLMPMAVIIAWMSIPMVVNSFRIMEHSSDPGGLLRWPIKIMIPLGFVLLALQGVAEIIKKYGGRHRRARAGQSLRAAGAMMLSFEVMAPLMFAGLIVFLLIGYPVAFSLSFVGLGFGFLAIYLGHFDFVLLQALPERIFGIASNQLLLSIPFFTFMGAILERCGLAEDLLDTMGQLFGPMRGGLAYSVILVGALLGAVTGTVAASVIAMGLISLPVMTRYGYDPRVSTGVIAASGTITQIIPPSLVLVVLADAMGHSVGDMYAGAFIPSFILVGLFCVWIFIVSIIWPEKVPALPKEVRTASVGVLFVRCMVVDGAVAGADLHGARHHPGRPCHADRGRRDGRGGRAGAGDPASPADLGRCSSRGMDTTLKLTTMVMFILVGSTVFSLTFRGVDGDLWVEGMLSNLPGGVVGFLVFVNVFVFFLAFFLDYFEIAFIIIPLLAPVAQKMGIDLIWFGVLIGVNMQTSFMHPPFGFALFYLRSVAPPSIKSSDILMGFDPVGDHHGHHGRAGDPVPRHGLAQHSDFRPVLTFVPFGIPIAGTNRESCVLMSTPCRSRGATSSTAWR